MSKRRGLWEGAGVAPHQDLSGLFVARAVQLYLRINGRLGFVLPEAALSRRQYEGFRKGAYGSPMEPVTIEFDRPWSLHQVKPAFFPVPACAVFGKRSKEDARALNEAPEMWSGRLESTNSNWQEAQPLLERRIGETVAHSDPHLSPYRERFSQGATVVPRFLYVVERCGGGPLGSGAGRISVRSVRSNQEKQPWKDLAGLEGSVEAQFVRALLVGESIVPFRVRSHLSAVIPWDGSTLLDGTSESLDLYPGLARWWRMAEQTWLAHRSSDNFSLVERLDFRNTLTDQMSAVGTRIVYSGSGMYIAASRVTDPRAVIEHKLYWCAVSSEDEAYYLTAILNSPVTTERVRPLQSRGEHNPRDFDKHIWKLPIPSFDESDDDHRALVEVAISAEQFVAQLDLTNYTRFEALRRQVRDALDATDVGRRMNSLTTTLLNRGL